MANISAKFSIGVPSLLNFTGKGVLQDESFLEVLASPSNMRSDLVATDVLAGCNWTNGIVDGLELFYRGHWTYRSGWPPQRGIFPVNKSDQFHCNHDLYICL